MVDEKPASLALISQRAEVDRDGSASPAQSQPEQTSPKSSGESTLWTNSSDNSEAPMTPMTEPDQGIKAFAASVRLVFRGIVPSTVPTIRKSTGRKIPQPERPRDEEPYNRHERQLADTLCLLHRLRKCDIPDHNRQLHIRTVRFRPRPPEPTNQHLFPLHQRVRQHGPSRRVAPDSVGHH
jgi:hypothetical protein